MAAPLTLHERATSRKGIAGAAATAALVAATSRTAFADEAAVPAQWDASLPSTWDREAEMVVVGCGIAGTCALLEGYEPHRGDFPSRFTGSIVSDRAGNAVAYALFNLEPRGQLFVVPGDPVYEGMIVGEHNRDNDIDVNPTKEKKLTNMRASGKDEAVVLTPVRPMTLEHALHFVREDELVEVTPHSIRLRKAELNALKRYQSAGKIGRAHV